MIATSYNEQEQPTINLQPSSRMSGTCRDPTVHHSTTDRHISCNTNPHTKPAARPKTVYNYTVGNRKISAKQQTKDNSKRNISTSRRVFKKIEVCHAEYDRAITDERHHEGGMEFEFPVSQAPEDTRNEQQSPLDPIQGTSTNRRRKQSKKKQPSCSKIDSSINKRTRDEEQVSHMHVHVCYWGILLVMNVWYIVEFIKLYKGNMTTYMYFYFSSLWLFYVQNPINVWYYNHVLKLVHTCMMLSNDIMYMYYICLVLSLVRSKIYSSLIISF